jgi:hypothetical protein
MHILPSAGVRVYFRLREGLRQLDGRLGLSPTVIHFRNRVTRLDIKMGFRNRRTIKGDCWQNLLILLAVCSLTLSLTTRFSLAVTAPAHGAKSADSRSGEPKRQHLDQDNIRFACPVETSPCMWPVEVFRQVIPTQPTTSSYDLSESLYNRPPPVSALYL